MLWASSLGAFPDSTWINARDRPRTHWMEYIYSFWHMNAWIPQNTFDGVAQKGDDLVFPPGLVTHFRMHLLKLYLPFNLHHNASWH